MTEFWEKSFIEKKAMWGWDASNIASLVAKDFYESKFKKILLPGCGYGRNMKPFIEKNMEATGIEISRTAIEMARKDGINNKIYHGSVVDMPFDSEVYDGIVSFALLHLLNREERKKLISACYKQLKVGGEMVFTTISKEAPMYGNGTKLGENYYETTYGVKLFFYDQKFIKEEFEEYGLVDFVKIDEKQKEGSGRPNINFWMIKCKKI